MCHVFVFSDFGQFVPDRVIASVHRIVLNNDVDTLSLQVSFDEVIDSVAYDVAAGFPLVEGVSIQLDPGVLSASLNDAASAWCLSTLPFGLGDLGSPGDANQACGVTPVP